MRRYHPSMTLLTAAALCFLLAACGGSAAPKSEPPAASAPVAAEKNVDVSTQSAAVEGRETETDYRSYDGFAYYLNSGQLKYALDCQDGLKLRGYFRSGDSGYQEEVYTIDLNTAERSGDTLTVRGITDGRGEDLSDRFRTLSFTFQTDRVVMQALRDPATLAGGEESSIQSGDYILTKSQPTAASEDFTPEQLCTMAQDYYERHKSFRPPVADYTDNGDGTYTIHLYEIVDDGENASHTATYAWYTVDKAGNGTDTIMGDEVHLAE